MTLSKDCDPAGDVVLKLGSGDEATLIRVQSRVLSLASPVFAAMLSPRFVEGQALEKSKGMADSTTTIDLPDDDPGAMNFICRILHFMEDAAQQTYHLPFIISRVAEICEKYDMSRALSPWSNIWLNDGPTINFELGWPCDRFERAWLPYALGHHASFWDITRYLVGNSTLAELNFEQDLLPDNIISDSPVSIISVGPVLLIGNPPTQVHSALTAKHSSENFRLLLKTS